MRCSCWAEGTRSSRAHSAANTRPLTGMGSRKPAAILGRRITDAIADWFTAGRLPKGGGVLLLGPRSFRAAEGLQVSRARRSGGARVCGCNLRLFHPRIVHHAGARLGWRRDKGCCCTAQSVSDAVVPEESAMVINMGLYAA